MKRFILSLMLLLPLSMVAQEIKIAIVNTNELFTVMPEVTAMENEMMALQQRWQAELQSLENDYTRKYSDFLAQQDSLNENIQKMRIQEIQDLQSRLENLSQVAQQDMEKKKGELFAPIQEKIMKAINEVGDENGYTCIFDPHPQIMLYTGKTIINATDKVKTKLGLK